MQRVGQFSRRCFVFLCVVEATAMYGPDLATDAFINVALLAWRLEMVVEPYKIE